ncbi:SRPBCC domain-containing protein [Actinoplanes sp. TFC3]|uniref:SRPBCC family protein n=1 Tax=Actinoplanes sp. TFC3 TaxID=1710355 RepID=UPI0008328CB1|nr:SRPBCC domain-containing protein [Actinoplanes sp. TFC3]
MGKDFETRLQAEVSADPEQVWRAIATGPGITAWFVGHTEITDDTVRTKLGGTALPAAPISATQPGHRFAYASEPGPDGRFIAYEYLIEGRDHSATVLRSVTSGFLPGDDWEQEYEAMTYGTELFFWTLVEYLRHFPGRRATTCTTFGPANDDWDASHAVAGSVYFRNPHTLGVRTADGLHRYVRGLHGSMVISRSLFDPAQGATS